MKQICKYDWSRRVAYSRYYVFLHSGWINKNFLIIYCLAIVFLDSCAQICVNACTPYTLHDSFSSFLHTLLRHSPYVCLLSWIYIHSHALNYITHSRERRHMMCIEHTISFSGKSLFCFHSFSMFFSFLFVLFISEIAHPMQWCLQYVLSLVIPKRALYLWLLFKNARDTTVYKQNTHSQWLNGVQTKFHITFKRTTSKG